MKLVYRFLFLLLLLGAAACHPRIYQFTPVPARTIGPGDSLQLTWAVKGKAALQIRDYNYPGSGTGPQPDLFLLVIQQGVTQTYTLHNDSVIVLALDREGSLVVRQQPNGHPSDILRYFTLVATKFHKDSTRVIQVAVRPDSVQDEVGFATRLQGDTLVAEGPNNPRRWGNNFYILSVLPDTGRVLLVSHAGVTRELHPGDAPDYGFKGTPVTGEWKITSPLTAAERSRQQPIATGLIVHFILKHT